MKRFWISFSAVFWLIGSAGGYFYMFSYNSRPAELAVVSQHWPVRTSLKKTAGSYELVMAVHPQCPCTRASVAELNKILLKMNGKVRAHALVYKPFELSDIWTRTETTGRLDELPFTNVHRDMNGVKALDFGLTTSGQVLLYAPDGKLAFNGGLTAFRGHEGPSLGQKIVYDIVAGRQPSTSVSKVFGCGLAEKKCSLEHEDHVHVPYGGSNG